MKDSTENATLIIFEYGDYNKIGYKNEQDKTTNGVRIHLILYPAFNLFFI